MTKYEKLIRHRLIDCEMPMAELARRVGDMTGLYCDTSYLLRNLSGERNAPKIIAAINAILGIEDSENAES